MMIIELLPISAPYKFRWRDDVFLVPCGAKSGTPPCMMSVEFFDYPSFIKSVQTEKFVVQHVYGFGREIS